MKVPVKLLTNSVDENHVFRRRKFVHPLRPKWKREAEQKYRFDQDNGEFQVRRNPTAHAGVVSVRMTTFAETDQNKNEKRRPTKEKRAHEPMSELEDVIDLIAVLGGVWWQAKELVDQRQATHIYPNPPRSV